MKVFRVRNSVEPKVIGSKKFPQVRDAKGDFNVQSFNHIGNSLFFLNQINVEPILPELVLWDSSKATDLISSSFSGTGYGLICSNKLKEIIEKVAHRSIQFFEITLHHKVNIFNYWYLHPFKANNEFIDYKESEIWEEKSFLKVRRREFSDVDSFIGEVKQVKYPYPLNIVKYSLKKVLPDFFILTFIEGGIGFFVSENIKNEIESAGCSGIVFKDPNELYP